MEENEIRFVVGRTSVDFDPDKDDINRKKHGYALDCAIDIIENALFFYRGMLYRGPYERNGEQRFDMMTEYQGRVVHVSATMWDGDVVRVISMRDARRDERAYYEANPPQFDISALLGE